MPDRGALIFPQTGSDVRGFLSDAWTLRSGSEEANAPVGNLQNPVLKNRWISAGSAASHNWIEAEGAIEDGDTASIDGVFLLNHNRRLTTLAAALEEDGFFTSSIPRWRIRVDTYPLRNRIRPVVSGITTTNLAGSYTTLLDSPDSPSGAALTASSGSLNTVCTVSFTTFNASERPLRVAPGNEIPQYFRVLVRDSAGAPGTLNGRVAIAVVKAGVATTLSAINEGSNAFGVIFGAFWNASGTGTTQDYQLRVTGLTNGSSSINIEAVEWIAEYANHLYDSGAQDLLQVTAPSRRENLHSAHILPETLSVPGPATLYVHIEQNAAGHGEDFHASGRLVIGPAAEFPLLAGGHSVQWLPGSRKRYSRGNVRWSNARQNRRRASFSLEWMARATALSTFYDNYLREHGIDRELIVVPYPDQEDLLAASVIYGTFESQPPVAHAGMLDGEETYSVTFDIEESV
jgi:hypothetical protein